MVTLADVLEDVPEEGESEEDEEGGVAGSVAPVTPNGKERTDWGADAQQLLDALTQHDPMVRSRLGGEQEDTGVTGRSSCTIM